MMVLFKVVILFILCGIYMAAAMACQRENSNTLFILCLVLFLAIVTVGVKL